MTGLVVTLVLFPLVGAAAARIVGRSSAYLMGLGMTGSLLYVALLVHISFVVAAVALTAAAVALLVFKRQGTLPPEPANSPAAATALMVLPIVVLMANAAIIPLHDYDGRAFWLLKAKAIAHEGSVDGPTFHDKVTYEPRNRYPLLVPIDNALLMASARDLDERHVRWLYPLALLALALRARRFAGPWAAALLTWIPQLAVANDGGVLSAYNDVPLAAFVGCAFFELLERSSPLRFGLWVAFAILTKSEGLPLAIVLIAVAVFVFRKRAGWAVMPAAVATAVLLVWRFRVLPGDEEDFIARLPHLLDQFGRFPRAISGFAGHAISFDAWGLFWFFAVAAFLILIWKRRWSEVALPAWTLAGISAIYVLAYVVTSWIMRDLINSSADRLLTHMVAPAAYVIGVAGRAFLSEAGRRNDQRSLRTQTTD